MSSVNKSTVAYQAKLHVMCQGTPGLMGHPGLDGPRGPKGSAGTVETVLF